MLWLPVKLHLHRPAACYLLPFDTLPTNAPLTPFLSHSLLFHIFPPFDFNCLRTHPQGEGASQLFLPSVLSMTPWQSSSCHPSKTVDSETPLMNTRTASS